MMYNGKDANISVSQMPAEDGYSWLKAERKQLSEFLSLLGDEDFLKCLPHLMGSVLSESYTAGYLSELSGRQPLRRHYENLPECSRETVRGRCFRSHAHADEL